MTLDGTSGLTTPGVVNTAGETIATTLAVTGASTLTGAVTASTTLAVTGVSTFAAGTALLPALTTTGDTNTGLWFPAADTVAASTGGTERMRIDTSGNLGVGTSSPTEKLDVVANASGSDGAIVVRTQFGAHYFGGVGNYPAFGWKNGGVFNAALGYDTNNGHHFTGPDSARRPAYLCRAWVNFNGTGTVAIRASGNVSSITDNGTGDYTVNFTTAMVDANYSAVGQGSNMGSDARYQFEYGVVRTTSAYRFATLNAAATFIDSTYASVAFFR